MPAAPSSRGAAFTCRLWLIGCIILLVAVTAQGIRYEYPFQTGTDPHFYFEFIYDHKPGSIDPLVDRCRNAYNGTLALVDTEEMQEAVKVAVQQYDDFLTQYDGITVALGGSLTNGDCPSGDPTNCPYCWDNGQRNCSVGDGRQFGLVKKDSSAEYSHTNGYNGWEYFEVAAYPEKPYVCYYRTRKAWAPSTVGTNDIMMSVWSSKGTPPIESAPSGTALNDKSVSPKEKKGLWWIVVVVLAVALLLAIAIVCWVFFCCWGGVGSVRARDRSTDECRLSNVRDTRSNRSAISGGGSMHSVGGRRSNAYSQCDVGDCDSNDDDSVSQGRSTASYY